MLRMPFGAKLTILFGWVFVAACLGGTYVFWASAATRGYAIGFAILSPFVLVFVTWMSGRLLTLRVLEWVDLLPSPRQAPYWEMRG